MKRDSKKKLTLTKERLADIKGGEWHRTSFRCHETFESHCTGCWTVCGTCSCTDNGLCAGSYCC